MAEQREAGPPDGADHGLAGLRERVERGGAPRYHQSAEAAGKLAEGKFLYNVTLQDDGYKFKTNKYALSDEEKSKLTDFAGKLKSDNRNVYIEIQGHTDTTGTAPGTKFYCRVNKQKWKQCKSPMRVRHLRRRAYVFRVKAVDLAGNADARPAKRRFKVVGGS